MVDVKRRGDLRRARANLKETMYLLRRARALRGDKERRSAMVSVVKWLGNHRKSVAASQRVRTETSALRIREAAETSVT
jgi:hypothetical protein